MALVEGCKHELEILIPIEDVARASETAVETIRARAHLQGFRPGKAPVSMIRKHYSSNIRQEVLDKLLPKFFNKKVEEERLKVVGSPNVTSVDFEEGKPIKFKAQFEVAPEFELQDYRGITVPYTQPEVTEEQVTQRIEQLRLAKADYVNLDPRPAESGDFVVVDLHSVGGLEGEPIHVHDQQIELGGADTMPGFSENIPGMSPGDEKVIPIQYAEEFSNERLAGRTVNFRCNLKMIQRRELPELNDEFAKDLGDFQTMDELRSGVRADLMRQTEGAAQRRAKDAIVQKLSETHQFAVPEAYVDRQVEMYIQRFAQEQSAMGRDPRKLNFDAAKVKEVFRDKAVSEIRGSLVLDRISEREGIATTQEEMDREVQRYSKEHREVAAAVRKRWQDDGTFWRISSAIQTEKTLNYLFEHARKEAPAAEQASE